VRTALAVVVVLLACGAAPAAAQADSAGSDTTTKRYRNRLLILPFVSYSPQTKLMFGAAGGYQFKAPGTAGDTITRPSYLVASGAYTTKSQWTSFVALSWFTPGSRWWLYGEGAVGYFPVFYYGIGPRTEAGDTNLMQNRFIRLKAKAERRIYHDLYAGLYYRLVSLFDLDWQFPARIGTALPGGAGGVSSGVGMALHLDSRNSIATPTRGRFLAIEALRNLRFLGSDFDYSHLIIDARGYLPVRRGRDVVALNLYGQFNGPEVPVQVMSLLSDYTTAFIMRGIYAGRFRDRHSLVAQADYRGHLKGRFGYVVFGAAGNVFGSPGNRLGDEMKFTYGAGLRFNVNPADPLNIRVDYTLSSFGESGLSLGATEAF